MDSPDSRRPNDPLSPEVPEPSLRYCLIHACLTANSTTLYTFDDQYYAPKLDINYAEMVSQNIGSINSVPEDRTDNYRLSTYMLNNRTDKTGSSSANNAQENHGGEHKSAYINLVLYYNKKLMKNNDLITLVILCSDTMLRSFVYNLMDKIMYTYLSSYYESPGLTVNLTTTTNFEFKLKMRDIIIHEETQLARVTHSYGSVDGELAEVRNIMNTNIDKILGRGQALDTLIDKTQHLNSSSNAFRRHATTVRRKYWWSNVKSVVLTSIIAILILYFLIGLECGLPFYSRCLHPVRPPQPKHPRQGN